MRKAETAVEQRHTAERLLDTAERLFGQHGYDAVGMRMLAQEAQVNLGAATYHFGTKKNLYISTFLRRFRATNAERLKLLNAADKFAQGRPLSVETILDCLVRPTYSTGLAHANFHTLVARSILTPPPFLHAVLHREFEPNIAVFIVALSRALPHIPESLIRLRVALALGSLLMLILQMSRMRTGSSPEVDESVLKELIRFVSAGMQSELATPDSRHLQFPFKSIARSKMAMRK